MKKNICHKAAIRAIAICLALSAGIFSSIGLSGCSSFEKKEYALYYDIAQNPRNLDPQVSSDNASLQIINNIMEGLYRFDDTGKVELGIAETVETVEKNGLVNRYTLRENAFWENGEPVTAHDFVFSFTRLFMPETNSQGAQLLYCIKNASEVHNGILPTSELGVRAVSDSVLEISLVSESENLPYLLTSSYTFPCNEKFFYDTKGKYGLESGKIMSNGPFALASWKSTGNIRLLKNAHYYESNRVLPSAVNLYVQDPEKSAERLKDEEIQASFIQRKYINAFDKRGFNIQVIENATIGLLLNSKGLLLNNQKIRQGIAACFDRDSYSDILSEDVRSAYALIPRSVFLHSGPYYSARPVPENEAVPRFSKETGAALIREGLKENGNTGLDALRLIINKDENAWITELFSYPSQILQREASVFINIEELDDAGFKQRLSSGSFDLAVTTITSGDHSPSGFLEPFTSQSPNNKGGYASEEYDELYTGAVGELVPASSADKYWSAEKKVLDDAAFIPMVFTTDYFVQSRKATGIVYNEQTGLISFKYGTIG